MQAVIMARSRRSGLPEYNDVGKGTCFDEAGKVPRYYAKTNAFSTISGCRGVCTALSTACVGYAFAVSGGYVGNCYVYGSALPDKGTGAAAPGNPLGEYTIPYQWYCQDGTGGSDTLTRGNDAEGYECHVKLPGAYGMHPPMPSSPAPSTF